MSFLNLRIRGRLYGGFGALLLFCAALASFGVWQLTAIRDQVAVLTLQSKNAIRVGEITTELQAIRRAILRYAFDQDEASFAESDKRLAKVSDLLEEAQRATTSEERRTAYKEVEKDMTELGAKRAALGDAVKQMLAGRKLLFSEGDQMAVDVQKFVDAAAGTPTESAAGALFSKVLLVRVANWRMLATRDAKGFATFKTNVANAQAQIALLEKADLPSNLGALLVAAKTGVAKYAEAFDKTGPNLVAGDQLYYKSVTPVILAAIEKMDKAKSSILQTVQQTDTETGDRISGTILTQEAVAGAAVLLGLLIAFLIARGIIGPLAGLTAGMKELASGNFSVVLPGLERNDEVGDMAQAVEGFKVKAGEKAREEAEAKTRQDEVAARQRKAEMHKLAAGFESAVGQIVETVSSASTELEASARTLTATAERAQQNTTTVATASEEASSNVQSVASATEE
ncbi:HAMP domain-containing protein, partial [Bradyrhizobium sp.]|uniref:HAMP domain-containing protein n=1 Tax=Bradyrhizobium sp. TaxID=376 RepID=UPI003C3A321B